MQEGWVCDNCGAVMDGADPEGWFQMGGSDVDVLTLCPACKQWGIDHVPDFGLVYNLLTGRGLEGERVQ